MKYSKATLSKLEQVLGELEYDVIYEKGTFKSGYCLLESKKVVVVNKFFDTISRINCLIEILDIIPHEPYLLSKNSVKTLKNLEKLGQVN